MVMPPKKLKQMPFTREDYYRQLDEMLTVPSQTSIPPTGDPVIDRLRMAGQKLRTQLPNRTV
mgnify:FL=1